MPKATVQSLKEEIIRLKSINALQLSEISKLNKEIDNFRNNHELVSKQEFDILLKDTEKQKATAEQYKKLYDNLKIKYAKEKDNYISVIDELRSQIKLNEKKAGRKAYSNKDVIGKIYELYLQGKSLQGISDELNRSEIKTERRKDWSKSSIRFILLNHKNVTNNFIDEDSFQRAVKLLNDKKNIGSRTIIK